MHRNWWIDLNRDYENNIVLYILDVLNSGVSVSMCPTAQSTV